MQRVSSAGCPNRPHHWCRKGGETAGDPCGDPGRNECRLPAHIPQASGARLQTTGRDSQLGPCTVISITRTSTGSDWPSKPRTSFLLHERGLLRRVVPKAVKTEDKPASFLCCSEHVRASSKVEVIQEEMNSPEYKSRPAHPWWGQRPAGVLLIMAR